MKRIIFSFALTLFACTFFSCQKEKEAETPTVGEEKVRITFYSDSPGKSVISESAGELTFTWEEKDVLHVYDGTKYCGSLKLKSGSGEKTGTFEGEISAPKGNIIRFIYLGSSIDKPEVGTPITADYYSQSGSLTDVQGKIVAYLEAEYSSDKKKYEGNLAVQFAIGKFDFSGTGVAAESKLGVRGLKQKIQISEKGDLSYIESEKDECAEVKCNKSGEAAYLMMPVDGDGYEKKPVSFVSMSENKKTVYSVQLKKDVFYTGKEGVAVSVGELKTVTCTVYYKNGDNDFKTVSGITGISHDIIDDIPTNGEKAFLGWSDVEGATVPKYSGASSHVGSELAHSICTRGYDSRTLYAVYSDGAWVDFGSKPTVTNCTVTNNSWETNKTGKYSFQGKKSYERFGIPIKNLEPYHWYSISFGEEMKRLTAPEDNIWGLDESKKMSYGSYCCSIGSTVSEDYFYTGLPQWKQPASNRERFYIWTHIQGDNTSDLTKYDKTTSNSIVFYASAQTMYWTWEMAKFDDAAAYYITIQLNGDGLKDLGDNETAKGTVDFLNATLENFNQCDTKAFIDTDPNGWKGFTTYKIYAENDNRLETRLVTKSSSYGKIYIPLHGLTSEQTYKLSFTCELTSYETESPFIETGTTVNKDFCYGVIASKPATVGNVHNTKVDVENNLGYSDNLTNVQFGKDPKRTFIKSYEFTATASEMYWAWSLSNLTNKKRFQFDITSVTLEPITEPNN